MEEWLSNETLTWVSIGSGICLLLGAIAVPLIVIKLPKNAFSDLKEAGWLEKQSAAVRIPLRLVKNILALVLVVLGIAMLVLPGQGILAILLGVMLGDFPGKLRLQRWLLGRPNVMNSLNWLRKKFKKSPLERPAKFAA
ncbi:MAG TPA: PGPGW domain-containing protein [Nitrospira sp.]|nr:PGPGW domain-containing protein [Nitrospira sp.]